MTTVFVLSFAVACAASLVLVGVARRVFTRIGFVDRPGHRKIHAAPVPYGGGAAIFATVLLTVASGMTLVVLRNAAPVVRLPVADMLQTHAGGILSRCGPLVGLLVATTMLFVIGLIDDRRRLSAWPKLLVQFIAAGIVVWGLGIQATFFVPVPWIGQVATLFWIVAITNAFNFLDNMDGLSAGVAAIALVVLAGVTAAAGQVFVPVLAVVLLGALVGFLAYNFPPASIFLGDAGSLTVGFLIAVLTVLGEYYRPETGRSLFSPFLPLVVLAVPLYDLTSVTLIRIARGKSPFVGDTNHFSHRLVALGLSRRAAVLTVYLATLTTSLGAVMLRGAGTLEAVIIFVQTLAILAVIAIFERIAGARALRP
ncbi:MAG: undecaprenyl/decaprenyl-phosphate alpha-N-acetylglucosaminyl 1-phosphate transferase [Planctomycetes bacterium]|nr:undecaprenyl/decaprenyl-phosphate alpha-N-acetylglucosaminyl 1-phosphate transferase [Planctomycetota bacterium]